ncbi:MFS transporter [Methylibium petroleiphilum]|uniref:MFS transporter n=1 Tax=Methylibium petroleiphilum TaxID=105560 RepID=UPI001AC18D63|nr:MFS transporter [Methylibium petroleiphilum]MBN9203588.1 MFS transporter [Methylibium petroleiphilum]
MRSDLSAGAFAALLAAAMAVSMAYGVTLPVLPGLVERAGVGSAADVEGHTGWLTGTYTLALFLFAPAWGALADRIDRRWVLVAGLAGSSAALWALTGSLELRALYAARAIAGLTAAAVLPAVFAYVVTASAPSRLQRRFAWIASATALGFLLGPALGGGLAAPIRAVGANGAFSELALHVVAVVGLGAAAGVLTLPVNRAVQTGSGSATPGDERRIAHSLLLTAVVVLAITVAEVGATLSARRAPAAGAWPVSLYFALCSGVMIAVQFWALPRLERRLGEPRLVVAALLVLSAGLGLQAGSNGGVVTAAAFVLAAAGIGVLIPSLAVRISSAAGTRQGWAMGRQAAAANLGQAVGAAATGSLFALAPPLPFLIAGGLTALAAGAAAWEGAARRTP